MNIKRENIVATVLCVLILTTGLYYNFPLVFGSYGITAFDWWSNGIMISDLMYYENYETEGQFLNVVTPSMIYPEDITKAQWVYEEMFGNYETFQADEFTQYTSNLVIQRYFYHLMLDVLPISHSALLDVLAFVNCAFAAVIITVILKWISRMTNSLTMILLAFVLVRFCPFFTMYGRNLYWCMGTIFLPMCAIILLITNRQFENACKRKQNIMLLIVAFLACLIKQLFYFEYVSTVMIAMSIPVFYYCICRNIRIFELIQKIVALVIGGLSSFGVTLLIRFLMICKQHGATEAIQMISGNIELRLLGTSEGAGNVSRVEVLKLMLNKIYIAFGDSFYITFKTTLFILTIIFAVYILIIIINKKKLDRDLLALLISCCISVAAPLSWFVLAAPHSYIHNLHVSITWFCPFGILFLALLAKILIMILLEIRKLRIQNNKV